MDSVLIDTDVILDVFLNREPFVNHSKQILELCFREKIHGSITSVIVANTYYLTQKREGHKVAINSIKVLMKMVSIIPIEKCTIMESLHSDFRDFEDAMQNYAAIESSKITTILTRNVEDFKHSRLNVKTPKEFLKNFL